MLMAWLIRIDGTEPTAQQRELIVEALKLAREHYVRQSLIPGELQRRSANEARAEAFCRLIDSLAAPTATTKWG
jgi:hypothetical protein